jgi:hypothetical protein
LGDPKTAVKDPSAGRAETSGCLGATSSGGGFSPSTTRSISSLGRYWSVTICGQRRQIAGPSWRNQRHCGRIAQCGSLSVTSARISTLRTASWHAWLLKCGQAHPWQLDAKRNTSVGDTGAAKARSSGVTSSAAAVGVIRGASGIPPTTPISTDTPGWPRALGHRSSGEGPPTGALRGGIARSGDVGSRGDALNAHQALAIGLQHCFE